MKMPKWVIGIRDWLFSWFPEGRKDIADLLDNATEFIVQARPLVEAIDSDLKPGLADPTQDSVEVVRSFLSRLQLAGNVLIDYADIRRLSVAECCMLVALTVLRSANPARVETRILRMAIEIAYNIYRMTNRSDVELDETEVEVPEN